MPRTSIVVIAAAAAATCALSACGPARLGSAAITGGQRITVTTLSDQVTNLERAYQAGKAEHPASVPAGGGAAAGAGVDAAVPDP